MGIPGRRGGRTAGSMRLWWDVAVWNQLSLWELSDCFGVGIEELHERLFAMDQPPAIEHPK